MTKAGKCPPLFIQTILAAVWKIKYEWFMKLGVKRFVRWMLSEFWGDVMGCGLRQWGDYLLLCGIWRRGHIPRWWGSSLNLVSLRGDKLGDWRRLGPVLRVCFWGACGNGTNTCLTDIIVSSPDISAKLPICKPFFTQYLNMKLH